MSREDRAAKIDRAGWFFLLVFAVSDFFSISVAQISAAGMGVCWLSRSIILKQRPDFSPLAVPVAAFVISSVISALLSLDVAESVKDSKDLLHLFILFAAYDQFRRAPWKGETVLRAAAAAGGIIAVAGLVQAARRGVDIYDRISGFHDMYMTYAGLLMMAIVFAAAVALFSLRWRRDAWVPVSFVLMSAAVLLSLTRSAWIGAAVGISALAIIRKPVALAVIPVMAAAAFFISPPQIKERITSVADMKAGSNRERLLVWGAGIRILSEHPVFGVGQNSFPLVYPKYRAKDVVEPNISHLHNNFLELAVERGVMGLLAWIWMWGAALWMAAVALRKMDAESRKRAVSLAAPAGAIPAFLAAGMFEYNFGDSEIQMMFYLILALAAATAKIAEGERASRRSSDLT